MHMYFLLCATYSSFCAIAAFFASVVSPGNCNEAVEGQYFTLICRMAHADAVLLVGATISYNWTRGQGNSRSEVLGTSVMYRFQPAAGDHGQRYTCRATISSPTLSPPIISHDFITIDVLGMHLYRN